MKCLLQFTAIVLLLIPTMLRGQVAGTAIQFDGIDDYVSVPDNTLWPVDMNAFTIELWVRFDVVQNAILIGQDEGGGNLDKWIVVYQGGNLQFHINSPATGALYPLSYSWTPTPGLFYHLAFVRNGSSYFLSIDGNLVATGLETTPIPNVNAGITIGQAEDKMFFKGVLDEVRIWGIAHSVTKIQENIYHPLMGTESGLISYWNMNESAGTFSYDNTGGNHGQLVNDPLWISSAIPFTSTSSTQIVNTVGEVSFAGSSLFAVFQSKTGTDTVTATHIPLPVQGTNPSGAATFHAGYWIVQSTSNGTYNTDLTFGLGAGALSLADQEDPSNINLYQRTIGTYGSWTLVGTAAKASFGSVTFEGVTSFGEFTIGTSAGSSLNGVDGVFQSAAAGNWLDASSWSLIGGTDDDGIPDGNDDVIIRAGEQIQITGGGYVKDLVLLGGSTGTRLSLADGAGLYINGILNSDATALSSNLVTTGVSANINFSGSSRQIIGNKWSGDVAGWTVNVILDGGDTAKVLTDFKAGNLQINSCMLTIGSYAAPKHLYIDGGTENSGTLSVNSAALIVSGNITRDNTYSSKFHSFTASWSTIEMGGTYLSAEDIRIGWPDYWYPVTNTFRIRATSGLLINSTAYQHLGTLEYIGTVEQTSGNELISLTNINIKNPAGVQFLTSVTITNLFLDTGNVTLPSDVILTAGNLFAKGYIIQGNGNIRISDKVETAHTNGLSGVFQNTGSVYFDNWAHTIVYKGTMVQHTGSLRTFFKDFPAQYVSFVVDNPAGILVDGSYYGNTLTLANGNLTITAPDTLIFNALTADANEIHGSGMYVQKPGTIVTAHANGMDGTIQTANYIFELPLSIAATFNGVVPQSSGSKLPDTLGGLSIQNNIGFTLSKSLFLPSFDLSAQLCDVNIPSGTTFSTGSFNGGITRTMFGAGNFILTKGGYFTTQHSSGINGTLPLSGVVVLGDSSTISFGDGGSAQSTGSLLPDTVQNIYFSNVSGTTLSKPVQVRNTIAIQNGMLNNSSSNFTLWDGAILQRNGGDLTTVPNYQNYYDVHYAGWTGIASNEIPDSASVLRNMTGGNWITLTKNTTVNGVIENHVKTDSFTLRAMGTIAPYMIAGKLSRYVTSAKQYSWEIADKDVQRYHPFILNATALYDSGDVTMMLLDTAAVPIPVLPAAHKVLRYYYTAAQHSVSGLEGTITLYYNDGDVTAAGIPDDDSLRVMQWKNDAWTYLNTIERDKSNNSISAGLIDTLTTFIIVGTESKGIAELSTKSINFGDVIQPNYKYDSIFVKNTGSWPLNISSAGVSPDYWTFGISPPSATIPIGDSVKFSVWMNALYTGNGTNVFFYHNGTTGVDTVTMTGRSIFPSLDLSAWDNDFGTIALGDSTMDSVTIYNKGTYQLIVTNIDTNVPEFSGRIMNDTIAPGDSSTVYFSYHPTVEGTHNGYIVIYNNIVGSYDNFRIYLSGTAMASQFAVSPQELSFGNVRRGYSRTDSVLVKNSGAAVLHIFSIGYSVEGYAASPQSLDIPINDSAWFKVTFSPLNAGNFNGEIIFNHSATSTPDSVHVSGVGVEPVFSANKISFNFGNITVGNFKTDSVIISNTGNALLNISSVTSSDTIQFSVLPVAGSINPGASKTFILSFHPVGLGTQNGSFEFTHDGNPDSNTITATGMGIASKFTASRTTMNYGSVRIDSVKTDTITVTNNGNTSLNVSSISVSDSQYSVTPQSVVLSPAAKKIFTISFAPQRPPGVKVAKVIFTHNGSTAKDTITLSGTAIEPIFTVDCRTIAFGKLLKGNMKHDSVTVTNGGNTELTISKITTTDSSFIVMPVMAAIAPNGKQIFTITFSPTSVGKKYAELVFTHNGKGLFDTVSTTGQGLEVVPILQARRAINSSEVVVEGVVTRALGTMARIQDTSGAIVLRQSNGALFDSISRGGIRQGDLLRVHGLTSESGYLKQINASDLLSFERLQRDQLLPKVQTVTLSEIVKNGEELESELLTVVALSIVNNTDTMFLPASSYLVVDKSDSSHSVILRIGYSADTQIDSMSRSKRLFTFTGVLSQSHASDSSKGYQLLPILTMDVQFDPMGVQEWAVGIPTEFILYNNFPNPFNPTTTIRFGIPEASTVKLEVYDLLGRRVAELFNGSMEPGYQQVVWNAAVSSGVYLYRIESRSVMNPKNSFVQVKKMMYLK